MLKCYPLWNVHEEVSAYKHGQGEICLKELYFPILASKCDSCQTHRLYIYVTLAGSMVSFILSSYG